MYVGVDGCSGGWVAIAIEERLVAASAHATFDSVLARYPDAKVVGVDIPLGLVGEGVRSADADARRFLRGQASSVFSTPLRPVLDAGSYADACAIAKRLCDGKSLSRQAFGLVSKIREVDAFTSDARVFEVHPEIAFRLMNGGARIPWSKKKYGGVRRRLALLEAVGLALPEDLGEANDVGVDDVIDAAAAAWTARRIARGEARAFAGEPEQRDRSGRAIAIWG